MKQANEYLRMFYLDYVNNYLTIAYFAHCHDITEQQAIDLLELGRTLQDKYAKDEE